MCELFHTVDRAAGTAPGRRFHNTVAASAGSRFGPVASSSCVSRGNCPGSIFPLSFRVTVERLHGALCHVLSLEGRMSSPHHVGPHVTTLWRNHYYHREGSPGKAKIQLATNSAGVLVDPRSTSWTPASDRGCDNEQDGTVSVGDKHPASRPPRTTLRRTALRATSRPGRVPPPRVA